MPFKIADGTLLRKIGKFGKNSYVIDTILDRAYPQLIEIGDNCIISGATILTHNSCTRTICDGFGQIGRVVIGNNVALCYGSIILCGTIIGDRSIVAAGAVVVPGTCIPSDELWGGIPAKRISSIPEYIANNLEKLEKQQKEDWKLNDLKPGQVFQYRLNATDGLKFGYEIDEKSGIIKIRGT